MANQINVGIQRQTYEPFEAADSEAENSGAEASLAGDSAGANTSGNPDVANAQVDGESVNQVSPETVPTNNTLNRYGIGDTVIMGRPEYAFNNRAASVENTFAPNETAEMVSFAMPSEPVSIDAEPALRETAMPTTMPTGFVPTSTPQPEPIQICPNQTDLPSSGMETTQPVDAKPIGKASTPVLNPHADIAEASGWKAVPLPPRDCAEYEIARAFGAAHGYSNIKIDKLTTLLYYANSETRFQYTPLEQPNWLSEQLDLTPVNADGTFDISMGWLLMGERHYSRASQDDSDAGNRNVPDGRADRGVDMMGVQQVGGHGGARAGAGQGSQDYANEMTAAAPGYGSSYDYDDTTNTYDSPDSTYDDPGSTPQIDLNPLPSLPPIDTNGPIMLPPPDIRVDHELAPIPNIGVADPLQQAAGNTSVGNSSGNNFNGGVDANGFNNASVGDSSQPSVGNNSSSPTAGNLADGNDSRVLMGYNAQGQPIYATGSAPNQGAIKPVTDAPALVAGDPSLRSDASGATPMRDDRGTLYYRINGGQQDGMIVHLTPASAPMPAPNGVAQLEPMVITASRGGGDESPDVEDASASTPAAATTALFNFSDSFKPVPWQSSTAASRLMAPFAPAARGFLAAEMASGSPQLRLAAGLTLTGVALWAAGRQNTEYEALSPEERDLLRQPLINVPPPPLPPFPGLIPPPVPDNSILPGTSTQPNNLPPLGGFQIAPPQTIDDLITESSRLPASNGQWSGTPGNSDWTSSNSDVNLITGGEPIPFRNGYPDFSQWSDGTFTFDNLTGQNSDFGMVYDAVANEYGLANRTEAQNFLRELGLTPHHVEDGRTIQLIPTALHNNIPHIGGASHLRNGG